MMVLWLNSKLKSFLGYHKRKRRWYPRRDPNFQNRPYHGEPQKVRTYIRDEKSWDSPTLSQNLSDESKVLLVYYSKVKQGLKGDRTRHCSCPYTVRNSQYCPSIVPNAVAV